MIRFFRSAGLRFLNTISALFLFTCSAFALQQSGSYPDYYVTDAADTYTLSLWTGSTYRWLPATAAYWEGAEGAVDEGVDYHVSTFQVDDEQPTYASTLFVNTGYAGQWNDDYVGSYLQNHTFTHTNGARIHVQITQNLTGVEPPAEDFTFSLTAVNHSSTQRSISIGAQSDSGVTWWASGTAVVGGTTQISDTESIDDDEPFTVSIYVDGSLYRISAGNTVNHPSGTANYNISLSLWNDGEEVDEINPEEPDMPDIFDDEEPAAPEIGDDSNDEPSDYVPVTVDGGADAGNDAGPEGTQDSDRYVDTLDAINDSGKAVTVGEFSAANDELPEPDFDTFAQSWDDMIESAQAFDDAIFGLVTRLRDVYLITTSEKQYYITIPWDNGSKTISWESYAKTFFSKIRTFMVYVIYILFWWQVYRVAQYVVTGGKTGVG